MSVYYYRGNQILAPLRIESNQPMFADDTVSLRHIRAAQNAQRWEISFGIVTNDNAVDTLLGMIDEVSTQQTMVMPQLKEVDDATTLSGNYVVDVTGAEGDTSVAISTTSNSGVLPKGSFVKFGNHSKVYITTADLDMSGSLTGTLNIFPSLRVAVTAGISLDYGSNCTLSYYRVTDNITGIQYKDGILVDPGRIQLIEAL